MKFEILRSTVHMSKWRDKPAAKTLTFEVVPSGSDYIEIGDKHVLSSSRSAPFNSKGKTLVAASVHISSQIEQISHIESEKPFCGYASFHPERASDFDAQPASLATTIVIDQDELDWLISRRIADPGYCTLHIGIDGLDYGWEPDGSHRIWNLEDDSDSGHGRRRRIKDFSVSIDTLATSERAIAAEADRRFDEEMADSPNPADRKIAAESQAAKPKERTELLLEQCRAILFIMLMLALASVMLKR